jgi:hypothetical protein
MRWRSALLTASSAALLAGCGEATRSAPAPKPPRIPPALASRLAAEADRIALLAPGSCDARDAAATFRGHVIASISQVPPRYREPLMSAANALAERLATCVEPRAKPKEEHPKKPPHEKKKHEKHRKKR